MRSEARTPVARFARYFRLLSIALMLAGCSAILGLEDGKVQGKCETEAQCAPGYGCLNGLCTAKCETKEQCPHGHDCVRGLCSGQAAGGSGNTGGMSGSGGVGNTSGTGNSGGSDSAGGTGNAGGEGESGGTGNSSGMGGTTGGAMGGGGMMPNDGGEAGMDGGGQGDCIPGTQRCLENGVETCGENETWDPPVPCPVDRTCVADADAASAVCQGSCGPGQETCSSPGNVVQHCNAEGVYGDVTACTSQNQTCVVADGVATCQGECAPDQKQCSDNAVQTCENGTWGTPVPCGVATCIEDATSAGCAGECAAGSERCSNNGVQVCSSDGVWGTPQVCAANRTCVEDGITASCTGTCGPNQQRCQNNNVQECNEAGNFADTQTCTNQTCVAVSSSATCQGACAPNQKQCGSASQPQTCGSSGAWTNATECADNRTCLTASGDCGGVCGPGQKQCTSPSQPQSCGATGAWTNATACAANRTCLTSSGDCGGVCGPGQTRCSGNGVQTCGATGQWGATVACTATAPHCSAGVCGVPPSCQNLTANCGSSSNDGCCNSPTVPGGSFSRGSDATYPATIATYALDKYEVTVGRFRRFVSAYAGPPSMGAGAHPLIAGSGWNTAWNASIAASSAALATSVQCDAEQTWRTDGTTDRLPMNCVNWFEAFAFCVWDGGRLPTSAEWEYAGSGGNEERTYPWGSTPAPSNTNVNYNCQGDGSAGGSCALTDILAAGSKPSGAGRYSHLDMAGSMQEMVLDWYQIQYGVTCTHCPNSICQQSCPAMLCDNCAYLTPASSRVQFGGSWKLHEGFLRSYDRDGRDPVVRADDIGFRCARAR